VICCSSTDIASEPIQSNDLPLCQVIRFAGGQPGLAVEGGDNARRCPLTPPRQARLPTAPLHRGARSPDPSPRFARPSFFESPYGERPGVGAARGQLRCPPPAPPTRSEATPPLDRPSPGPVRRKAHRGRSPGGLGAAGPLPWSAIGAGGTPGGGRSAKRATAFALPPSGGSVVGCSVTGLSSDRTCPRC